MSKTVIILIIIGILILGAVVFPLINKHQLKNMPHDQQIRILMKQAKGLNYFKNISSGNKGALVYIKNKRKILYYPWVLAEGKMVCTKKTPYDNWDYPEERPAFREEEILQAQKALADYNKHSSVKLYLLSDNEDNKEEKK